MRQYKRTIYANETATLKNRYIRLDVHKSSSGWGVSIVFFISCIVAIVTSISAKTGAEDMPITTDKTLSMENKYLKMRFSWQDGLRIDEFVNTATGDNAIIPKNNQRLFVITTENEQIDAKDFNGEGECSFRGCISRCRES